MCTLSELRSPGGFQAGGEDHAEQRSMTEIPNASH